MFPEFRELISKLKVEDAHFARLFNEHNDLDEEIKKLENDIVSNTNAADEIHKLKQKKLALKDELYSLLKKASGK